MHATILPILVVIDTGTLALSCKITDQRSYDFMGQLYDFILVAIDIVLVKT